jgi:hypothetical protein
LPPESFSGVWLFDGTLLVNTCNDPSVPYGVSGAFSVVEVGGSITVTTPEGVALTGSIRADGSWVAGGTTYDNTTGCSWQWTFWITPTGPVIYSTEPAGRGVDVDCGSGPCDVEYTGTATLE